MRKKLNIDSDRTEVYISHQNMIEGGVNKNYLHNSLFHRTCHHRPSPETQWPQLYFLRSKTLSVFKKCNNWACKKFREVSSGYWILLELKQCWNYFLYSQRERFKLIEKASKYFKIALSHGINKFRIFE